MCVEKNCGKKLNSKFCWMFVENSQISIIEGWWGGKGGGGIGWGGGKCR